MHLDKQEFIMEYMNKLTDNPIKKLAVSSGVYDSITDPHDSLKNGDNYSSVMPDLERFAKLIIQECIKECIDLLDKEEEYYATSLLYEHFGIKHE